MEGRGDKGIFITTGGFTSQAKKEASRVGAKSIDLIGGERLCELLADLKMGDKQDIVILHDYFKEI